MVLMTIFYRRNVSRTAWKVSVFGVFLVRIFPHSVRMQENTNQENSEYRHFSRCNGFTIFSSIFLLNRKIFFGQVVHSSILFREEQIFVLLLESIPYKSSHQRCSIKILFLKILQNSQENRSLLNKIACLRPHLCWLLLILHCWQ